MFATLTGRGTIRLCVKFFNKVPVHEVKPGECVSSIADAYGFLWETVWNHPSNASLRQKRRDPNVLAPGDILFVPDRQERQETAVTDKTHRFVRKGVPALVRLALIDLDGKPRGGVDYRLEIDRVVLASGTTGSDGVIEHPIPPGAVAGRLIIGKEGQEVYTLRLGHLDPASEVRGVQDRLRNLGFDCGEVTGSMNDQTIDAIRAFQKTNHLQATGELDDATRARLESQHGA